MKAFVLAVNLAVLAAASANQDSDDEKRYLDKWGNITDEYNRQHAEGDYKDDDMEYTEEFWEAVARRKRSAHDPKALVRRERSISSVNRKGSPMQINLVTFEEPSAERKRVKRATFNTTAHTWPDKIPYVFNESYPAELRPKVRLIMKEIMDRLCITWVEEKSFDPPPGKYETNAYLHFVGSDSNICGAFLGQGAGKSPRKIKTCTSYYTITHELLHTLGTIHEQQGPLSSKHVSLAVQNVIPSQFGGTYSQKTDVRIIETSEFDSSSIMMYSRRAFTKNGFNIVLPFRMDELTLNNDARTDLANNLQELNTVYKCREKHCGHEKVDCGVGYYTYLKAKGGCHCVCPRGFDPKKNCQELENENSGPTKWPDVGFTMYAYEKEVCPDGFTHGSFDITGTRNARYFYTAFPSTGRTTNYHMCTRVSNGTDMDRLPMGTYCVVKAKGQNCTGGFTEGGYVVKTMANFTSSGDFGDWEIQEDPMKVKMKFCCRVDKEVQYITELPRKTGFSLISRNGKCPTVEGMRYNYGLIVMFVPGPTRYSPPQSWKAKFYLIHGFCKYRPGTYGCNEQVTLNSTHRQVTIKTPGFDLGQRTNDKRCLYNFNVPPGARVKVTMDVFDVDDKDLFYVRRFHKWAMPQLDFASNFKKEFISEKDFLFLEWWAGEKAKSGKKGVQLTAKVLLKEESCHGTDDRGKNYVGSKSVTETFEECLPWKAAVNCEDFPFDGSQSLKMLSHNFCRNPAGAMERPWCYVSVNRGMCMRRYCDVCNELNEVDQVAGCQAMIEANPTFCNKTLQRMKCAGSCGFNINVPPPNATGSVSCHKPPVPFDGTPVTALKDAYGIGEVASFTCNLREENQVTVDIECSPIGWPSLTSACSECPAGWIPYGDRCFFFSAQYRLVDEADEYCRDLGARLFEIRDRADLETLRYFKQTSTLDGAYGSTWVNTKQDIEGNWTLFDHDDVNAPLLDWSENCVLNDFIDHGCAVMIWERDTTGNAGKFNTTSCNLGGSRTFCEMPRAVPASHNCTDTSASCVSALVHDPDLCTRVNSYHLAQQYCQKSCGECAKEDHEKCSDPSAPTYTRTSESNSIYMGEVMQFACNPGQYLVHGNLKRVCGHDGNFLGPEPVCSENPIAPAKVGVSGVLLQGDTMPTNYIFLVDVEGFRIPFAGNVTQWHFYGVKAGDVNFVIYRRNEGSGNYKMIGYNTVKITHVNERWTYQVHVNQQIQVQEGDVYGFFTIEGHLSGTSCEKRMEAVMTLKKEETNEIDASMIGSERPFTATACLAPSVGLTVNP